MAFYPIPDDQDFQPIHCQPLTEPVPTDPTPNRPPLWRVMNAAFMDAFMDADSGQLGPTIAAEIRALADWLVPEEPEPPDGYAETSAGYRHTVWEVHDELRDRLLAEADRAEAGE